MVASASPSKDGGGEMGLGSFPAATLREAREEGREMFAATSGRPRPIKERERSDGGRSKPPPSE